MFHLESIPVTDLIISAMEARKKAYAPYSNYMVGAAPQIHRVRARRHSTPERIPISRRCKILHPIHSPFARGFAP